MLFEAVLLLFAMYVVWLIVQAMPWILGALAVVLVIGLIVQHMEGRKGG